MEISKETKKHLMQVIAFAILLYCGIEHIDVVIMAVRFVLGIAMPFLIGGAIAFILNVPMKKISTKSNKKMMTIPSMVGIRNFVWSVLITGWKTSPRNIATVIGNTTSAVSFSTVPTAIIPIQRRM